MNTTFSVTAIAVVVLLGAAVRADVPAPRLRLDSFVAEIRRSNPTAAGAMRRVEAARITIDRARALPDPFLQGMLEDVPLRVRGGMPMVRVIGSQMLPWFGKRDRMAAVSAREADAVAARADVTVLDVVTAGRRAYYGLLLNRQARAINREQRAIVDTVVEIATGRLRSGTGMHHDVLKMQTEATMLDDALLMLDADRREMAAMVNALLDRPAETPVGEPEDAWTADSVVDRARLVEEALAHRPELREMTAMERAERAMADSARREYYPDVMVGGLYDFKMDQPDTFGGMLGLNIPIWIGSKQRLDVQAAETRARAIDRERAGMAAMVRAEIERQLARMDAAERRGRLLDTEFIPRAQQTFDSAIRAFPSGMVDTLSLLDSLRALETQKLNRIAVRVDREMALIDLERAVGLPLKEIRR
jgi:cobalt-zinc-cadmium efflux system outer membrane protein